ncbi:MAG: type II secretion system protein [Candidatus Omnitrophota bacterium]
MNKKGITLIEMVTVIVVLAVSIPILLTTWADIAWRSSRSEVLADAAFYAQELMEEIKTRRYDEMTVSPWTSAANFGSEAGENRNNKNTFDDIDDFVTSGPASCTDPSVLTPAGGYTRSVSVDYVRLNLSTWESCGSLLACGAATTCTGCNECCYKRITVTVSRTDNLVRNVNLVTIMSAH